MTQIIRLPLRFLVPMGLILGLLIVLPTLVIVLRSLGSESLGVLNSTAVEALRLSLLTTSISLGLTLLFGTPIAYLLARYRFWGHRVLDTLIDLPILLPPTVAGVGLLLTFGRRGFVGQYLNDVGITLAFTTTAVVMAQLFVASPLYIRAMKAGFQSVPEHLEGAALSLGASRWRTFCRVTLPLTLPYLLEGAVLMWARALGEFGATIVFAGSLIGRSQTMPLAIYATLEQDLDAALKLSAILTVLAFALLLSFRALTRNSYSLPES